MTDTVGGSGWRSEVREGYIFSASFAQRRLWFMHQLNPDSAVYNIPAPMRVKVPLDVEVLRRSLNEIVRRHESLRTTFASVDGEPVQVIAPELDLNVDCIDLRNLPADQREKEAQRLASLDAQRPFSLSQGPLLRATLVQLGVADSVLLLTMHHIVSDGWSVGVLLRELGTLYNAFSLNRQSPLPKLPIQYADFAEWQRGWLEDGALQRQLEYWRGQLAGAPELIDLPTDRARPALQSYRGGMHALELDDDCYAAIRALGNREGATSFMTLLAAFKVLLLRYSGEHDLVVATTIANRTRTEVEDLIGLFVNTIVLRTDLSGDLTFIDVLARVREVTLDAYAHQDMPFERLVEELQPARNPSHNPLFQVMFVLHSADRAARSQPGEAMQAVNVVTGTAKFDLTLSIMESGRSAKALFEYNTDLFDHATIECLAGHFARLLASIVREPHARVSALSMMTPDERRQVVYGWNDTAGPSPIAEDFIHNRFADQAERRPDATALVTSDGEMSYGELLSRANRLATHLRAVGIRRGALVAVCMERSAAMVVALIAILRAGAAYVPLDPEYPARRLAYILEDARPRALVTERGCLPSLLEHDVPVVRFDEDWPAIAALAELDAAVPVDGSDLAYVIYTSGSTGRPKGAMNTHAGIANRLLWMQSAYSLSESDRVLHKTPTSFDVSVWELFWPLITGATMVIARPGGNRAPDYLAELMHRERITTAHFVPSMLRALLECPDVGACVHLRRVIASGEELAPDVVGNFHRRLAAELHNLYGPTEAAIDVTAWPCSRNANVARVPIGRPIANTAIYVLDASLEPVPPGVSGELYIGGIGVGPGYRARPGLTAEYFVPDPFAIAPGGRLYRTGDRARRRADGVVEFLGRLDTQTKVRGLRIELEEIELALRGHDAVRDVAVAAHAYDAGDTRLVAYVIPDAAKAPVIARLVARQRDGSLEGHALVNLANGLTVAGGSSAEVEFMYREIFEEQVYLRHGITLPPGACIFDVGANIGLFDLFVSSRIENARVYAFEPIPEIHERLAINLELHAPTARAVNRGLASAAGRAAFTYYPHLSILSGRYADAREDAQVVLAYEQHQAAHDDRERDALEEVVAERLVPETVVCELTTLSDAIAEHDVAQIDLLKIDAEKSEYDVLLGIGADDWPRIRQIVIEVHDRDGRLERTRALLEDKGYCVVFEKQESLGDSGIVLLYAWRAQDAPTVLTEATPAAARVMSFGSPDALRAALRDHAAERLPEHMVPADVVFLDALPHTPNGKLDRRALPAPQTLALASAAMAFVAPRTPLEAELAQLFADILHRERVGVRDDFFELGGHSLLATRVVARIHEAHDVALSLRRFFETPTVEGLAAAIAEGQDGGASAGVHAAVPRLERRPVTADVDQMSDDEVAQMLDSLLAEETGDG